MDEVTLAKKKRKRRIIVIASVLVLLITAGILAYSYYDKLANRTSELFTATATPVVTAEPVVTESDQAAVQSPEPEATPMPDPFAAIRAAESTPSTDLSGMGNIVNIALIGVDYSEERETWSGKEGITAAHADVIIILAVDFDNNTASLISLPRDTYTYIPGVSGIYKLNAALNCGGGIFAENGAGFLKVCETSSYLLGGIPVDYYYAVTMPAVKGLVDAIGGVTYRVEMGFTMQNRHYHSGTQHLDGQGVLDYLRVRKEASGLDPTQAGDAHRVIRQKNMLLTIFKQLKKKDTLLNIADIIDAFDGQLFTNCTTEQTAALALYAYNNVDAKNISMYSMSGSGGSLYTWNFSFVKQKDRIEMIKKIYGIDVPEISEITKSAATLEYRVRQANRVIGVCNPLTEYVQDLLEKNGDDYSDYQKTVFDRYLAALDECVKARNGTSSGKIQSTCSTLKHYSQQVAGIFGYRGSFDWTIPDLAEVNEIYVDFR